jgi:DNA modification methylase
VVKPYYADEAVTLYHGDCREVTAWLEADVLVTDPPYGRGWEAGSGMLGGGRTRGHRGRHQPGIAGDRDATMRDAALELWEGRLAIVFGDPLIAAPTGAVQVLAYAKPGDAGAKGARAGFRRDAEFIWLAGPWPAAVGGQSSILSTSARCVGSPTGMAARYGHPHAKPVDVMETLIAACPPGVIADPFAGAGSTLVAARNLGRKAVGVELDERYCEKAARRLSQQPLMAVETAT